MGFMATLLVAAVALTSCVGIGAVTEGDVRTRAQERGGGVTTNLVDDAIAEVSAATGQRPLEVHSITATLAQVTIVVPAEGGNGRDAWTYGTSGLLGGKGLEGPTPAAEPAFATFPVEVGQLDVDGLADRAREEAGGAGRWVDSVTVARLSEGAEPITTVVVTDGGVPSPIQFDADGELVLEGEG
jgi:hypothetical protein